MRTSLTPFACAFVLGEAPDAQAPNPIRREGATTYLLFDEIVTHNTAPAPGALHGLTIEYRFHGNAVARLEVEGRRMVDEARVHLTGFEGRMVIDIHP